MMRAVLYPLADRTQWAGGTGRRILVIEDDDDVREVLVEILVEEGYCPVGAPNGLRALELLRGVDPQPAVILLDLMMPVMDGWQFLEQRKREPALLDIPVVVMSAAHDNLAKLPGSVRFLRKPVDVAQLVATLDELWAS